MLRSGRFSNPLRNRVNHILTTSALDLHCTISVHGLQNFAPKLDCGYHTYEL
uniref:Uncharacterized protein n=1 Tax=Physcomitrium patens TaxID=3218 RepID=A0A2K1JT88_PHYPA|nr:hypothetical protein PHYPA_014517 [Physcomitrium patens]